MSSQRRVSDKHTLPNEFTELDFPRTDGDGNTWPRNTVQVVDDEGQVNFMKPLGLEDSMAVKWRISVGTAIANHLGLPPGKTYVLKSWPKGYAMFDHHKGRVDAPRHDIYLFGSKSRFRSIPEFVPHAIWLFDDATLTSSNCQCKYCGKVKSQREITAVMAGHGILPPKLAGSPGPSLTPSMRKARERPKQRLREKVFASVQKVAPPLPSTPSRLVETSATMLVERDADLRGMHVAPVTKLRRLHREGELLWCELNPSIEGPNGRDDAIKLWPGLVDESNVKTFREVTPGASLPSYRPPVDSVTGTAAPVSGQPPWTVKQIQTYKVKLLGVQQTLTLEEDQVLPYQAYGPSEALIQALNALPAWNLDFDEENLQAFNPTASPAFNDAIAPFALAIQIASSVSKFWSLTDQWEYRITSSRASPPRQSIADALNSASTANAVHSASNPNAMDVDGPSARPSRVLGSITRERNQVRFQGLWWGGERVWVDDLLRLKIPRRNLAPDGQRHVFRPSGPGKASVEQVGADSGLGGADTRGVFLRLNRLFIADVVHEGRSSKECRASGMLYELAEEDWEETERLAWDPPPKQEEKPGFDATQNGSTQNDATSMQPPAPMKPTALPNVNPSVPVSETTESVLGGGNPSASTAPQPPHAAPNFAHSRPYPLPEPPSGYKFRAILPRSYEATLSLTLVSGRYYPGMLSHPLLADAIREGLAPENPEEVVDYTHLWALEGLAGGYANSVDPVKYKRSRKAMLDDAAAESREQLLYHKRKSEEQKEREDMKEEAAIEEDVMEVDELDEEQLDRMIVTES